MSRQWVTLRQDWETLSARMARFTTVTRAARREAQSNMLRYFSFLAQESGSHAASFGLLGESFFANAPAAFWEPRNWRMLGATSASAVLSRSAFERLLKRYGIDQA
jgi:hypothetical protein